VNALAQVIQRTQVVAPLAINVLQQHHTLTGSAQAAALLAQWPAVRSRFVKVFPHEYRRALSTQQASAATAQEAALA